MKIPLAVSVVFFVIYGLGSTIGSIFLVSWGSSNWFKRVLIFLGTFPIDWNHLIINKSIFFLFLNILFWTAVVYVIVLIVQYLIGIMVKALK